MIMRRRKAGSAKNDMRGSVKADAGLLELESGGGGVGEDQPPPASLLRRRHVVRAIVDQNAPSQTHRPISWWKGKGK